MTDAAIAAESRIQFLWRQRRAIDAELRHLLGSNLPRPQYHCLRCGHDWLGRYANRRPAHCSRCHSRSWEEERPAPKPKKVYPPRRRPEGVPPPEGWKPYEGPAPATLPPPPAATLPGPSLAAQFQRRVEEPQPEARITAPPLDGLAASLGTDVEIPETVDYGGISRDNWPGKTESVVETVQHNMDEAVRIAREGLDAGIKIMMDDTPRTLAIVEAELEKSGE